MRGWLVPGAVVVAVLIGAAPADAAMSGTTGSLTISWRGDRARGCAEAGECGVTGSLFVDSGGGFTDAQLPVEKRPASFEDPGYAITTSPRLQLQLTRTRIGTSYFREPTGP
jgi:hypothetical protein